MKKIIVICVALLCIVSCVQKDCHEMMLAMLEESRERAFDVTNEFVPEAKLDFMDSVLQRANVPVGERQMCQYVKANLLLELGKEDSAVSLFLDLIKRNEAYNHPKVLRDLGIACLRLGERSNCISNHAAESCILPIKGVGIHQDAEGSRKAILIYERLLNNKPADLESLWLLNLAYMTLGE